MRTPLLFAALALGLTACSIENRPNLYLSGSQGNLIAGFTPDRGEGATYRVGDAVRFNLYVRTPGYVTIYALQNGMSSTLARNVYVREGLTVFGAQNNWVVALPTGLQRVRVIFSRTKVNAVSLNGPVDLANYDRMTGQSIAVVPQGERDMQETYFYIR